jgi:hypothetical protein
MGHGLPLRAETRDGLALVVFVGCFLKFFFIDAREFRIAHSVPCPESSTPGHSSVTPKRGAIGVLRQNNRMGLWGTLNNIPEMLPMG